MHIRSHRLHVVLTKRSLDLVLCFLFLKDFSGGFFWRTSLTWHHVSLVPQSFSCPETRHNRSEKWSFEMLVSSEQSAIPVNISGTAEAGTRIRIAIIWPAVCLNWCPSRKVASWDYFRFTLEDGKTGGSENSATTTDQPREDRDYDRNDCNNTCKHNSVSHLVVRCWVLGILVLREWK